jgi:ankyrin repeat protein
VRTHASARLTTAGLSIAFAVVSVGAATREAPVADAAMRGDSTSVRALLLAGADPNGAQGDGMTGLHWAAERGDVGIARVLLDAGADLEPTTRLGAYRPLHLAARGGHAAVVDLLLATGAEASPRTETGSATPLHFAAASGSDAAVRALLTHGAEPDAREERWGQTPLMFAAAAGRTAAVLALLDGGSDVSLIARVLDLPARDTEDATAEREHARRVAAIRAEGQAVAGNEGTRAVEAPRPTQESAGPSRAEINERQRDRGPQPLTQAELIGGYGGLTALLLAVREGRAKTVAALVDRGADVNQPSGGDRTSPLLMATVNGHFDLAMFLLERGADPNQASDAGATPLYATINTEWIPKSRHPQPTFAMQQHTTYRELMTTLLDLGADPNVRLSKQLWFTTFGDDYLGVDRMGATPFWRAAYALDVDAMKLLVSRGADPDIPTLKPPERRRSRAAAADGPDPSGLPPVPVGGPGVWPIHAASGVGYGEGYAGNIHRHVPNGWLPAVRYLVEELGVDPTVRDHNGYNAIHHAASRGDNEVILYLVAHGVDPTAVARTGQTTADMANGPVQRIPPFPETVALLERLGSKNNHNCVGC